MLINKLFLIALFSTTIIFFSVSQNEKVDTNVYIYVDEAPEFKGGHSAMVKFIQKKFRYPQYAIENNIEGKCYLKFVVSKNGKVTNVEVDRGINGCEPCNNEAVRVLELMPKWKPAKVNGKKVDSLFRLPIDFKLE